MEWTWDPAKAASNLLKHKVSFELAVLALEDEHSITVRDPYPQEERWRTIGSPVPDGKVLLYVVHTWPDDEEEPGRIISARKVTAEERKDYEDHCA